MRSLPQPIKKRPKPARRATNSRTFASDAAQFLAFAGDLAAELGFRSEKLIRARATPADRKVPGIWAETWDATYDSAASNAGRSEVPNGMRYH